MCRFAHGLRCWSRLWVCALALGLLGCGQSPVAVGFLGGLTGAAADLGVGGRDGAFLAPAYGRFTTDFVARYGRSPIFVEVAAYDAMQVVLSALAQQRSAESLKDTLLRLRRFSGLQQDIVFDDHGDSQRRLLITRVENGRFVVVP